MANINHCNICKKYLDQEEHPETRDCGGDCLECMARYGDDPDCIKAMAELGHPEFIKKLEYMNV